MDGNIFFPLQHLLSEPSTRRFSGGVFSSMEIPKPIFNYNHPVPKGSHRSEKLAFSRNSPSTWLLKFYLRLHAFSLLHFTSAASELSSTQTYTVCPSWNGHLAALTHAPAQIWILILTDDLSSREPVLLTLTRWVVLVVWSCVNELTVKLLKYESCSEESVARDKSPPQKW